MYGDDYRDRRLVEDGWALNVNGRQKKVLELAGRVRNVALSVRNRSRADGKSRGRSIDQPIVIAIVIRRQDSDLALCLSCLLRLSLGRSVT
jgi:hypothetical protein